MATFFEARHNTHEGSFYRQAIFSGDNGHLTVIGETKVTGTPIINTV